MTSPKDKDAFVNLAPNSTERIEILPNGVDLDYFQPGDFSNRETETLVVSGKMSYHANINMVLYLVKQIMPMVWKNQPDVKLWVVGKDPPKEILSLADNNLIKVTGYVDSILPYLSKASIAVAPLLYGAGIQNKVLEAMACGTPVITTPKAISALNVEPGREILVGETAEDITQYIFDLLGSNHRRKQIGDAGRSFVEQHHNWKIIGNNLEKIYNKLISR